MTDDEHTATIFGLLMAASIGTISEDDAIDEFKLVPRHARRAAVAAFKTGRIAMKAGIMGHEADEDEPEGPFLLVLHHKDDDEPGDSEGWCSGHPIKATVYDWGEAQAIAEAIVVRCGMSGAAHTKIVVTDMTGRKLADVGALVVPVERATIDGIPVPQSPTKH